MSDLVIGNEDYYRGYQQGRADERAIIYEIINDIYDSIDEPNEDDAEWFNAIVHRLEQDSMK